MKKILTLAAIGAAFAAPAMALDATGAAWYCSQPGGNNSQLQYCRAIVTSATTATQLGRVNVDANRSVAVTIGVSGSALSGVVTPSVVYYVGNQATATQSVSATSTGNVVMPTLAANSRPLFTQMTISQSNPALISATNALIVTVTANQ